MGIDELEKDINERIRKECEEIRKADNPRETVKEYVRNIRWHSPELAAYLKKTMSVMLNLDD